VSNAVRYTDRGGVVIGCRRRGERLRIEVWDSGIGIPKDQWENVFGEFYRISGPGRERRGGLGLGLAIVERLCRLLDHRVELRSTPGKGSCLAVEAPLVAAQAEPEERTPVPEAAADPARGKLIVVIDDDALVLDSMRGVLRTWGCFVVAAESGRAALASLNGDDRCPDLIISDYRLSDGDAGITTVEELRVAFGAPIPAFLITGDTAPERLREARASGLHLLHKPVAPMALRAMLNQLLREGRSAATSSRASAAPSPAHRLQ
jgi:CheY-like chemotaxis protein